MLLWLTAALAAESPTLEAVLASVERHYPLIQAEAARAAEAQGQRLGASGIFDPVLAVGGYGRTGPYGQAYVDGSLTQATPLYGLSLDVGYRLGTGKFASYDGKLDTLDGGAVYADLRLPLLKGGLTDDDRTALAVARLEVDAALAKVDLKRLEAVRDARFAWWKWVASGAKLEVGAAALAIATTQQRALDTRVARGDAAAIELTDADRVVLERRTKVVELQRELDAAALKLGLYLRDAQGDPAPPLRAEAPDLLRPEAPGLLPVDEAITTALRQRPELAALRAKREQALAKVRLGQIAVLPKLDLKAGLEQDLPGAGEGAEALDLKLGGELELPLLLRPGRGKLLEARAGLDAVEAELRFLGDRIVTDVQTAHTVALAAHEQARLADETATLAAELESATRRRYELGDTDLFQLYLREQSTLKAALDAAEAWGQWHAAVADLEAVIGLR